MRNLTALSLFGLMIANAQAANPPEKAAAPGSPGIYLDGAKLAAVLKSALAAGSDPALSPVANTDQYMITQVHRAKSGPAAAHPGWTEVHIILSGTGTFVTGGMIKESGTAKTIDGGLTRRIAKGDVIIVPAGSPHQYTVIDAAGIDAIEVRFAAPTPGQS